MIAVTAMRVCSGIARRHRRQQTCFAAALAYETRCAPGCNWRLGGAHFIKS